MIDKNGYFDWADRDIKLPEDHRWYADTPVDIVVCHSLEGVTSYWYFLDPDAPPWKGWHATITYDGTLRQHCPIWWGLAHGNDANPIGPGFESEGFADEPLTAAQVKTWRRMLRDLAEWKGRQYTEANDKLTEHRDWSSTACPSERYAPLYKALLAGEVEEEVLKLTPEVEKQIADIVRRVVSNEDIEEDERLRGVQFKRNSIEHVANHPDADVVETAYAAIASAGLFLEGAED